MTAVNDYGETVDGNLKKGARDVYELCENLIKERDRLRAEKAELVEVILKLYCQLPGDRSRAEVQALINNALKRARGEA